MTPRRLVIEDKLRLPQQRIQIRPDDVNESASKSASFDNVNVSTGHGR